VNRRSACDVGSRGWWLHRRHGTPLFQQGQVRLLPPYVPTGEGLRGEEDEEEEGSEEEEERGGDSKRKEGKAKMSSSHYSLFLSFFPSYVSQSHEILPRILLRKGVAKGLDEIHHCFQPLAVKARLNYYEKEDKWGSDSGDWRGAVSGYKWLVVEVVGTQKK
jgi:hypothetical protein